MKVSNKVIRKPYQQGDLDALCGVYCLINIVHYMTKLNKTQAQALFIDILKFLEKRKRLSYIINNGLRFRDMKSLINEFLPGQSLAWCLPFHKDDQTSLDEYWGVLREFLVTYERGCILLRITGNMDHWTLATSISNERIYLLDSNHSKLMHRKHFATAYLSKNALHIIWPAQTIFIHY